MKERGFYVHEARRDEAMQGSEQRPSPAGDEQLQGLVSELSLQFFGKEFAHRCRYNGRLRSTAGRYLLRTHDLEFSVLHARTFGYDELVKTILHELCHYHLHLAGRGFRHRDPDFKRLLQEVGGSRYARPLTTRKPMPLRFTYRCVNCQSLYRRRRRIDTGRFVCGACRHVLQLISDSAGGD